MLNFDLHVCLFLTTAIPNQLAINEAILEEEEEEGDADGRTSSEEEPVVPRTRNRPKREVEVSS